MPGSGLEAMSEAIGRAGKGKGPEAGRKRACDFADALANHRAHNLLSLEFLSGSTRQNDFITIPGVP